MGLAEYFLCGDCGHRFLAGEDFGYGMIGEVHTPVVCAEHGLISAPVGVNLVAGDRIEPVTLERPTFPCPMRGKDSPRWNGKSCPKCGGERLGNDGIILSD